MNRANATSAEDNKAILLQLFSELKEGKTSSIDEVCSPDFAFHSPNFPNWPRGLKGARKPIIWSHSPGAKENLRRSSQYLECVRACWLMEPLHPLSPVCGKTPA